MTKAPTKARRGFAAMSPELRREIASRGGKAVPPEKRSFSTNAGLAAKAGKIGGTSIAPEKRSFAKDPKLAKSAGRAGGLNSGSRKKAKSDG